MRDSDSHKYERVFVIGLLRVGCALDELRIAGSVNRSFD